MIRRFMLAAAAASLVATPIAAQAAPSRTPAKIEGKNEQLVGLLWQYLILPLIIAAAIGLLSGDKDEAPRSP